MLVAGVCKHRLSKLVFPVATVAIIAVCIFKGAICPPPQPEYLYYETKQHQAVHQAYKGIDAILSRRYIAQLEEIRLQLVNKDFGVHTTSRLLEVFRANDPHYFQLLGDRHPEVRTIFFNESVAVVAPNLVKYYYVSVVSDCRSYQELKYGGTEKCLNRTEDLEQPYQMTHVLEKETIFNSHSQESNFMHIITGAIVTPDGDVIKDNFTIIPNRCQMFRNHTLHKFRPTGKYARHREVLTIAQFWGNGFFHFIVEDLPRIAAYLPFMKRHPEVKVHVTQMNSFTVAYLSELGIAPCRLVSGNVEADVLYMPAGTPCGQARLINTQLLSSRLRRGLTNLAPRRDTVILIRRSKKRWFDHHHDILAMIRRHADPAGLKTVVYADNPVPGLVESRRLFSRAFMVVAPHGAGIANIVFSQPGTIVVEGMYYLHEKPNWCFRILARVLGHRYYGLLGKQCMLTTASDVEPVVKYAVSKFKTAI